MQSSIVSEELRELLRSRYFYYCYLLVFIPKFKQYNMMEKQSQYLILNLTYSLYTYYQNKSTPLTHLSISFPSQVPQILYNNKIMNLNNLLSKNTYLLQKQPKTQKLTIQSLNQNCTSILLTYLIEENQKVQKYEEVISDNDFKEFKLKEFMNPNSTKKNSILFMKLAIEREYYDYQIPKQPVFQNVGEDQEKPVIQKKVERKIIYANDLVWDKIVKGKQKIEKAISYMTSKKQKSHKGIILNISAPQNMLIVLPKVIQRKHEPKQKPEEDKETEQEKAKKVFFKVISHK